MNDIQLTNVCYIVDYIEQLQWNTNHKYSHKIGYNL
jgi:hypothetical protein